MAMRGRRRPVVVQRLVGAFVVLFVAAPRALAVPLGEGGSLKGIADDEVPPSVSWVNSARRLEQHHDFDPESPYRFDRGRYVCAEEGQPCNCNGTVTYHHSAMDQSLQGAVDKAHDLDADRGDPGDAGRPPGRAVACSPGQEQGATLANFKPLLSRSFSTRFG